MAVWEETNKHLAGCISNQTIWRQSIWETLDRARCGVKLCVQTNLRDSSVPFRRRCEAKCRYNISSPPFYLHIRMMLLWNRWVKKETKKNTVQLYDLSQSNIYTYMCVFTFFFCGVLIWSPPQKSSFSFALVQSWLLDEIFSDNEQWSFLSGWCVWSSTCSIKLFFLVLPAAMSTKKHSAVDDTIHLIPLVTMFLF